MNKKIRIGLLAGVAVLILFALGPRLNLTFGPPSAQADVPAGCVAMPKSGITGGAVTNGYHSASNEFDICKSYWGTARCTRNTSGRYSLTCSAGNTRWPSPADVPPGHPYFLCIDNNSPITP